MKYLESALKFLIKNWILAVPLFVLVALAALLGRTFTAAASLRSLWLAYGNIGQLSSPGNIFPFLQTILPVAAGGGILTFIFNFIAIPATYGLVNKSLDTGHAGLNDIGSAISGNFAKYVMYILGVIVVSVALGLASFIILLVMVLITAAFKPFIIVTIIIAIALTVAIIIIMLLLSLWLPAMIVDGLDLAAAAKKSVEIVRSCFLMVLGITLLVGIGCGIAGSIIGWLGLIPFLGKIITSIVPAAQSFIMITFLLIVYRERTGRTNCL